MERWEAKLVSLAICALALFTAVALPIKVSQLFYAQGPRGQRWLDIINCFGGGVFLGTYLLTFPQVRVLMEQSLLQPQDIHYPLPELLLGAGFFLIMLLEKAISCYKSSGKESEVSTTQELQHSPTVTTLLEHSPTVTTLLEHSPICTTLLEHNPTVTTVLEHSLTVTTVLEHSPNVTTNHNQNRKSATFVNGKPKHFTNASPNGIILNGFCTPNSHGQAKDVDGKDPNRSHPQNNCIKTSKMTCHSNPAFVPDTLDEAQDAFVTVSLDNDTGVKQVDPAKLIIENLEDKTGHDQKTFTDKEPDKSSEKLNLREPSEKIYKTTEKSGCTGPDVKSSVIEDIGTKNSCAQPPKANTQDPERVSIGTPGTDSNNPEASKDSNKNSESGSALKAIILMAALAIDNVFIGLGLGLRGTSVGVWNMLVTILSHELVISFTLGLALVRHNPTRKVLVLAAVYAAMCPIGIAIGTVLLDTGLAGEGIEVISGVLQALASGVFLYVTFFEILEGHVGPKSSVGSLIAILAGFILMALLALLEEGSTEVPLSGQHTQHLNITSST